MEMICLASLSRVSDLARRREAETAMMQIWMVDGEINYDSRFVDLWRQMLFQPAVVGVLCRIYVHDEWNFSS
jgi:hypothetical protein